MENVPANASKPLGQFLRQPAVQFERQIPGPIERVWQLLTDTSQLPGWFGEGSSSIEPRVGGSVRLLNGHVRGVVTQWQPPHLLIYTWNVYGPNDKASPYPESYVKFELEDQGDEVRLRLTHLPVLERFEKQNGMGWHTFLDMLAAAACGENPADRSDYMKRNASLYGVDLEHLVK